MKNPFKLLFQNNKGELIDWIDVIKNSENAQSYIYTMAKAKAINLIAKTIAKTELLVYGKKDSKSKKIENLKNNIYYLLNIQPNANENGTEFLYKLALKLLIDEEVLVLINDSKKRKYLYIADTFKCSDEIMKGKSFYNISLSDNSGNSMNLRKSYDHDNSIYVSIKNSSMNSEETTYRTKMSELIKIIETKYKTANIPKWRLKKPGSQPTMIDIETGKPIKYDEYIKKITDGLFSDEAAVIMLAETFDLMLLNKDNKESLADYKDIIKSCGDSAANFYNIPLDLYYGTKTEKSVANNDFISFCVDVYYSAIEDSLNSGLVGEQSYIDGERIQFNKYAIFHKDILDSATGIDKLISNTFSRNEVNEFIGLPQIDEDWANEHNLTKNYANVKGGEDGDGK